VLGWGLLKKNQQGSKIVDLTKKEIFKAAAQSSQNLKCDRPVHNEYEFREIQLNLQP
jgi:hypothetical protein